MRLARYLACATAVLAAGCALTGGSEPAPRTYELAAVTVRYMALDDVNRACEGRMHNGKPHWGCATFNWERKSCEILAQAPRHKLDFDRAAVLGVELDNCMRMAAGEPQ